MSAEADDDVNGVSGEPRTALYRAFDPERPTAFTFKVVEGDQTGETFTLDGSRPSRVLVGKSPACDLQLTDATVSRRHAALDVSGPYVRIADLDSTNGTYVDGIAVVEACLSGGEAIRLGSTTIRVDTVKTEQPPKVSSAVRFGRVIGGSLEMRRLYTLCHKLAESSVPVVVEGETGTGKELLAESIHEVGPRKGGPFVVFDCTAVPANLLEAELFGHERGAFTGAVSSRSGVFEQANGGTLLIDEIGELPLALQPKLLRAIERREIRPIGSANAVKVDVRVISATRRDLDKEVQAGRFRDDLFHPLAVGRIELPPLARRRGDIPVLAKHFCQELGGDDALLPPTVLAQWEDQPFPGNVRELRNTVARHVALGELASMSARATTPTAESTNGGDAPPPLTDVMQRVLDRPLAEARQKVVEEFERRYIERMLARHGGNVTHAAETAGVARRYFQILKAKRKRPA